MSIEVEGAKGEYKQAWTSSMLTGLLSSDSLREERYSSLQLGMAERK